MMIKLEWMIRGMDNKAVTTQVQFRVTFHISENNYLLLKVTKTCQCAGKLLQKITYKYILNEIFNPLTPRLYIEERKFAFDFIS